MSLGPTGNRDFVTSGGGFTGSHLVNVLVELNDVTVLDDFSTGSAENSHSDPTVLNGDVRDESTVNEAN